MAASSVSHACIQHHSESYKKYLECDSLSDILVGLCAGRYGLVRIQRQKTLKYFQSFSSNTGSEDESSVNEETMPLESKSLGTASRHPLSRENSNLCSGATSFYSAIPYQISNQNVAEQKIDTRLPIALDTAQYTFYSIPSSPCLRDKEISLFMTLIPIACSRLWRYVLSLEAARAEGAEFDRLQAEKRDREERARTEVEANQASAGQSIGPVVESSAVNAYISQNHAVERWDIRGWIDGNTGAVSSAQIASRTPARQCVEYYLMKNFNPLSVHRQYDPEEERRSKNMAVTLARARRKGMPLEVRRRQLAVVGEARIARALMAEDVRMAETLAEEARRARETSMARQANIAGQVQVHETHQPDVSRLADDIYAMHVTHNAASLVKKDKSRVYPLDNMLTRSSKQLIPMRAISDELVEDCFPQTCAGV